MLVVTSHYCRLVSAVIITSVSSRHSPTYFVSHDQRTICFQKSMFFCQILVFHHYLRFFKDFLRFCTANNNLLRESQFTVLRKCQSKFDCLVFEMLFIKKLKPNLNIQTDSIRAKLFCLILSHVTTFFFSQLLLFFQYLQTKNH